MPHPERCCFLSASLVPIHRRSSAPRDCPTTPGCVPRRGRCEESARRTLPRGHLSRGRRRPSCRQRCRPKLRPVACDNAAAWSRRRSRSMMLPGPRIQCSSTGRLGCNSRTSARSTTTTVLVKSRPTATQMLLTAQAIPSYLEYDWRQDWGEIERFTPIDPDAQPGTLDTTRVERSGRWTRGPSTRPSRHPTVAPYRTNDSFIT